MFSLLGLLGTRACKCKAGTCWSFSTTKFIVSREDQALLLKRDEMRLHGDELVSRVALRPSAPVSFTQAVARLAGRSSLAGHSLPQARSLTSATFVSQVPAGGIDHTGHKGHTGHIGGIGHID